MTANELLILTLLAEEPRSGYDVDRAARQRRLRSWTPLGTSSVYFVLESLCRRGLASARTRPGLGGPERHVCGITKRGRAALRRAVAEALSAVRGPAAEPDLALMNLFRTPRFAHALAAYERAAAARIAETRAAMRTVPSGPYALAPRLIFQRHILFLRAELAWCRHARKRLERRRS